jgi:hypothetical protein
VSGAASCSDCSAGYACGAGSTSPTPAANACPPGRFSIAGATSCSNCTAGYVCPTAASTTPLLVPCDSGQYSLSGAAACTNCSAGRFGASTAMYASGCTGPCPSGRYSLAGAAACTDCTSPVGYGCGIASTSATGSVCSGQQWGRGGAAPCQQCPAGFSCRDGVSTPCPAGFYCVDGAAPLPCNASLFCPALSAAPTSCIRGSTRSLWFDVDGDGDLDAVSGFSAGWSLWLPSGDGAGTCVPLEFRGLPMPPGIPRLFAVDVDSDGDSDVVFVSGDSGLQVFVNNGSGHFANASRDKLLSLSVTVTSVLTVSDVDGDGDLDLVAAANAFSALTVLRNNGSGAFTAAPGVLPAISNVGSAVVLDVDRDGYVDVAVTTSDRAYVVLNSGSGSYGTADSSRALGIAGSLVGAGDFDGDGALELVSVGAGSVTVTLNSRGSFVTSALVTNDSELAIIADVSNDGVEDIVVLIPGTASSIVGYLAAGGLAFAPEGLRTAFLPTGAFVVDTNNDTVFDAPSVGYNSGTGTGGGTRTAHVRVLSRGGAQTCHGATVRVLLASTGAIVATRVVGAVAAPYDVHVAVNGSGPYALNVSFPSGRWHSMATQPQRLEPSRWLWPLRSSTLLVVRDVPAVVSARVAAATLVGVGGRVNVTVTTLGSERGLVASRSCTINGANVSSSLVDWYNGSYTFTYTAAASHPSSLGSVAVVLALTDATSGVTSDEFRADVPGVSVDTVPPLVSFNGTLDCSPDNNSVTAEVNQSLCVSCGTRSAEPFGCTVFVRSNASWPVVQLVANDSNAVRVTVGPLWHGATPRVEVWAQDAAGNVGPVSVLTWEVDTTAPVTSWTPFNPSPFSNTSTQFFSFGCSQEVCGAAA